VTLVRRYAGKKKKFVGIPAELYDLVEKFAERGKYTFTSVVETALEDFLEIDPDEGAKEEASPATNGNGHHGKDRIVVVRVEGKAERLAMVVDENPKPGFKTIRLQDGRSTSRFAETTTRVLEGEIKREATLEERLKGLSL
jgi:hypothetical protein